jgi:hypothetical protein
MIIPPLSKPNRTPDNVIIFSDASGAVTRRMVSIVAVLNIGTSVLYLLTVGRTSLASRYSPTLCMI